MALLGHVLGAGVVVGRPLEEGTKALGFAILGLLDLPPGYFTHPARLLLALVVLGVAADLRRLLGGAALGGAALLGGALLGNLGDSRDESLGGSAVPNEGYAALGNGLGCCVAVAGALAGCFLPLGDRRRTAPFGPGRWAIDLHRYGGIDAVALAAVHASAARAARAPAPAGAPTAGADAHAPPTGTRARWGALLLLDVVDVAVGPFPSSIVASAASIVAAVSSSGPITVSAVVVPIRTMLTSMAIVAPSTVVVASPTVEAIVARSLVLAAAAVAVLVGGASFSTTVDPPYMAGG